MKHIKFTYVDAVTGISVASEPAANGPVMPGIKGLTFEWAKESEYPTAVPHLYGTCPNTSSTMVDGVLEVLTEEIYKMAKASEMAVRVKLSKLAKVQAIVVKTSTGKSFDGDELSQTRMMRAIAALKAASIGATDWVLADNTKANVSGSELEEAFLLATAEQSRIWMED